MAAFTHSFAQSGNSCGNPIAIGALNKDTTLNISFNYPDTVKWLSFSSDSSLVSFLASSNKDNIGFIKIKELNVYNTSCNLVTSNIAHSYPGKIAAIIRRSNLTANQTYLIKLVRYYDTSLNDTSNREVFLNYRGGSNTGQCLAGLCNNLAYDGGFENHVTPLVNGFALEDLNCWTFAEPGGEIPVYFNENYTSQLFKIPNQNTFNSGINLPTQSPDPDFFPNPNTGYIGINTNQDNSDITQGFLSTDLIPNTQYFVSYLVSPGKNYVAGYHDRIDLDVLHYSNLGNYDPAIWGANYAAKTPALQSGVIDFNQPWTQVSNVFNSGSTIGESIIYIGNLAQQPYTTPIVGAAQSYYIDNVIIKPFELDLGPDIVACEGQMVDITVPCQYLYPGATYTWDSNQPGFTNPGTANLSFTAIGNYWYDLEIKVINPQGGSITVHDLINVTIAQPPTIGIQVIGGPQGMFCEDNGILYIVQGNQVSLTGVGAGPNGTYNWYIDGTLVATNQLNIFIPGLNSSLQLNTTYEVTLEGSDGTCTGEATLKFVLVSNRCHLPCNTVLGENAFTTGPNPSSNYTNGNNGQHLFPNSSTFTPLAGETYVVDGTFTVVNNNTVLSFTDCTLLISPGGKIINNGTMALNHCVVDACEQMWDRIDNYGTLTVYNNTAISNAEAAIELRANSSTKISGSTFTNNIVGVFSRNVVNSNLPKSLIHFSVVGTTFQGIGNILATMRFTSQFSQYTGLTGSSPVQQPEFYLRPANGINIRDVVTINIGSITNNALPNHFINMWNGITFKNTAGIIDNCRFIGMEANANHGQLSNDPMINEPQDIILTGANPNFTTHYNLINSNAIAILGGSNIRVNSLLNDDGSNPTIRNCFRGIFCYGSNLTTVVAPSPNLNGDMMFIRDVSTGLRCENNAQIHQLIVQQLDIIACNLGIAVNLQQAGSVSNVRFNNILMQALPGFSPINMRAIQHRQIVGDGTNTAGTDLAIVVNAQSPQVFININNNIINTQLSKFAIEIWGGTRTRIFDNFVNMEFTNNFRLGTGIDIVNCFGSNANCNYITTTGIQPSQQFFGGDDFSAAIRLKSSENIGLSCNETERFWDGLSVNYPSSGGIFQSNTFRNEQSGLHYRTFADVGDQLNNGNRWQNPFNNTIGAARADMPNIPDYGNDIYATQLNSVFTPPSIVTSANATWFIPSTLPQFDCQDAGFVCNWVNPDREGDTTNFVERLVDIAKEKNDSTEFGDEKLWMSKNYLIKELLKNDSIAAEDSILVTFLDSARNSAAYQLQMLIHKMNAIQFGDSVSNAQLTLANEIYNLKLEEVYEAESNYDSILVQSLSVQLGQAFTDLQIILNQINANKLAQKIVLEAELNALTTNNAIESNMKKMLLIYLNSCYINNLDNLSNDEAAISAMAYQCPMEFGDAVYWARTMLSMLHENLEFNDEAVCQAETNQRRANIEKLKLNSSINKNTLIYPNPASNNVFVLPKHENCQSITVRNQFGAIIWNSAQVNRFPYEINLENISSGMYVLEIVFEQNKIENHKLTIFH